MATTETNRRTGSLQSLELVVTSESDGSASHSTANVVAGKLVCVYIKPGSGSDQPSDGFNLTLTDRHSRDVLLSGGSQLSNAAATQMVPKVMGECVYCDSTLDVAVSAAGSGKKITVIIQALQAG